MLEPGATGGLPNGYRGAVTEFRLLGPLEVRRDGGEIPLGGRNQRALLALLLLQANRIVSIERLAEALYGGDTPVTAVTQVHRQVSELRRLLDPSREDTDATASAIETRPPGYVIRVAPGELDLHRFERLTRDAAAAMTSGDPQAAGTAFTEALD